MVNQLLPHFTDKETEVQRQKGFSGEHKECLRQITGGKDTAIIPLYGGNAEAPRL